MTLTDRLADALKRATDDLCMVEALSHSLPEDTLARIPIARTLLDEHAATVAPASAPDEPQGVCTVCGAPGRVGDKCRNPRCAYGSDSVRLSRPQLLRAVAAALDACEVELGRASRPDESMHRAALLIAESPPVEDWPNWLRSDRVALAVARELGMGK